MSVLRIAHLLTAVLCAAYVVPVWIAGLYVAWSRLRGVRRFG